MNERVEVVPVEPSHAAALGALLRRIEVFTPEEVACAEEVFGRAAQSGNTEYVGRIARAGRELVGAIAYGQTPMTVGTWDMYWILSDPALRRTGIGRILAEAMEADIRRQGARLIRVETSGTPAYQATRAFYEGSGYRETARLREFYKPGDDLVIFTKRV